MIPRSGIPPPDWCCRRSAAVSKTQNRERARPLRGGPCYAAMSMPNGRFRIDGFEQFRSSDHERLFTWELLRSRSVRRRSESTPFARKATLSSAHRREHRASECRLDQALHGCGGDGGIRTLDTPLQAYNGLANRRLQPLGHVSGSPVYAAAPDATQASPPP
jgi:hypothetical protein